MGSEQDLLLGVFFSVICDAGALLALLGGFHDAADACGGLSGM